MKILDDSVMNNRDSLISADMRVSIAIGRSAVGGPAGVPHSRGGVRQGVIAQQSLKVT